MFRKKSGFRKSGFHTIHQGVADVSGGDAVIAKKTLLKRENAQEFGEIAAHAARAALAPGPYLRRDQIDHGNPDQCKLACDAQMKIR